MINLILCLPTRNGYQILWVKFSTWEGVWDETLGPGPLTLALASLKNTVQSGGSYVIEVEADESLAPQSLSYSGVSGVTVTLRNSGGTMRTVSLGSNGALFTVGSGVTLVLENNITLSGRSGNDNSVVRVNAGGTFLMEGGTITGNTASANVGGVYVTGSGSSFVMSGGVITGNTSYGGAGVYITGNGAFTMSGTAEITGNTANNISGGGGVVVNSGSSFNMQGGSIYGNTASSTDSGLSYGGGGGVKVWDGVFTMSGGSVSNNTTASPNGGGGVRVVSNGSFTMSGTAAITGNKATNNSGKGGGVSVTGSGSSFTMQGGTVSGNTARGYGGGVYVDSGNFSKTGSSSITGFGSDAVNGNAVKDGSDNAVSNCGHAVYAMRASVFARRETSIGSGENISFNGSADPASWEGVWDETLAPGPLTSALVTLKTEAQSGGSYVIEVEANESIAPQALSYSGRSDITVILRNSGGTARTVSLGSSGALFTVGSGVTLVLESNITLSGRSGNDNSVVRVNAGGAFV